MGACLGSHENGRRVGGEAHTYLCIYTYMNICIYTFFYHMHIHMFLYVMIYVYLCNSTHMYIHSCMYSGAGSVLTSHGSIYLISVVPTWSP